MQLGNEAEPHGEFVSAVVVSYADSRGESVWKNKINTQRQNELHSVGWKQRSWVIGSVNLKFTLREIGLRR